MSKRRKTSFDDFSANVRRVAGIKKTFQDIYSTLRQVDIEDIELLVDHQQRHCGESFQSSNEVEEWVVAWLGVHLSMEGLEALRCCHHLLPVGVQRRYEMIDR